MGGRWASTASRGGADEVGYEGFEGVNEVGDYDEYEDVYVMEGKRWKRITRLITSTSISRKILMGTASGITLTTLMMTMTVFPTSDDDDDGDGVTDREDS